MLKRARRLIHLLIGRPFEPADVLYAGKETRSLYGLVKSTDRSSIDDETWNDLEENHLCSFKGATLHSREVFLKNFENGIGRRQFLQLSGAATFASLFVSNTGIYCEASS